MVGRTAFVPGAGLKASTFYGVGVGQISGNGREVERLMPRVRAVKSNRVRVVKAMQSGLFTDSQPSVRKVSPKVGDERKCMKVVYVVLESQYQSTMTAAANSINSKMDNLSVEVRSQQSISTGPPSNPSHPPPPSPHILSSFLSARKAICCYVRFR